VDESWEWQTWLVGARRTLEIAWETELRDELSVDRLPTSRRSAVASELAAMAEDFGSELAVYMAKYATEEQLSEFLVHRSVSTLREADPYAWAIPRLVCRSKVALAEIQAREYGDGRLSRMLGAVFATTMQSVGLGPAYARYVELMPALTLATVNMASMFGLNRRLRGALVGHLAALEMTSATPNLMFGNGFRHSVLELF
jgi:hypothetical protein